MPEISLVDDHERLARLEDILAGCEKRGTPGADFVKVLAHRPEIARTFVANWNASLYEGEVDHRLKELVRLYLAQLHGCSFCQSVGSTLARDMGLEDAKVQALGSHETDARFTGKETAALSFAEDYFHYEHAYDDLRQQFSEPEMVELIWFVALQDASQRVATKLRLEAGDSDVLRDQTQTADD